MTARNGNGHDVVAALNDLIRLDHDAVRAYAVAIDHIEHPTHRTTLSAFRDDHVRHIHDLGALVTRYGGVPADGPHAASSLFLLMMQHEGRVGGDRTLLMAFRVNEAHVRDKYNHHAGETHPADVALVIQRNARDEVRHYAWVERTLVTMGAGSDTRIGTIAHGVEAVQGSLADAADAIERMVAKATRGDRRSPDSPR